MANNLIPFFVFFFFLTSFYFFFESSNFLNILLFLELLSMVGYTCLCLMVSSFTFSVVLYFLVMSVCEAAMGLTLVIIMTRNYGDVMFKTMNFCVC